MVGVGLKLGLFDPKPQILSFICVIVPRKVLRLEVRIAEILYLFCPVVPHRKALAFLSDLSVL